MTGKVLMKGTEAIGEAAIRANCQCFFGYPITPQTEVAAYLAKKMPEMGRVFVQAESEVAAIHMIYGAGGTGVRCMTSSSSPGISLMSEGISYIAAAEVPCLIINIMRGGPGLGTIQPAQSDYFQATKGGGHGDYNMPVFAPSSIQEMVNLIQEAFDVADLYRTPCMIVGDGMLGQMMEPVEFIPHIPRTLPDKDWAATGLHGRTTHNVINSLYLEAADMEQHNVHLQEKFSRIKENEVQYELVNCDRDNHLILTAYGTSARICKNVIRDAEREGIRLGLVRPITLWPFPTEAFDLTVERTQFGYLTVEMSAGQMVQDVRLAVNGRQTVEFYGRMGGMVPHPEDILARVRQMLPQGVR